MSSPTTRGVLYVHSAPRALCPLIQWALESIARQRTELEWTQQNAEPGSVRTELEWSGPAGTGALLASALRTMGRLRFEVTENPCRGHDGARWLPAVIEGIRAQTVTPERVVAVDTGSRDESADLLAAAFGEPVTAPAPTGFPAAVQPGLS